MQSFVEEGDFGFGIPAVRNVATDCGVSGRVAVCILHHIDAIEYPDSLSCLEMAKAHLDLTLPFSDDAQEKLMENELLIFRKEEVLNMGFLHLLRGQTHQVQTVCVDIEGLSFQITHPNELCAVFYQEGETVLLCFDSLVFCDVGRDTEH